jgi:hypothetical protein
MVRVVYLTSYLAHEILHYCRTVDGRKFPLRYTNVLEVMPDHGWDGDGVPSPHANRAWCVILVHRADLELAFLEEENLRVLVPVEDGGPPPGGTVTSMTSSLPEVFSPEAFIVVTSVTTSQCSPSLALVTLMVSMEILLTLAVRTI